MTAENASSSPQRQSASSNADEAASRRQIRLARKVTLVFGFMSFIPLLLMVWALIMVPEQSKDVLRALMTGIIVSVFVGYFVLKRIVNSVLQVVEQSRAVTRAQLGGSPPVSAGGDEVLELARTFNRVTQELEHKIDELEMSRGLVKRLLSRIGPALVSYEGIDNLLELIVENIGIALEAHMGSLMLVNGQTQELDMKTAWSLHGQHADGVRVKVGEGIAGWVAKERRLVRGTGTPGAVGLPSGPTHDGAVLSVPLTIRDQVIGVLSVWRANPGRAFSEDDEVLMSTIASQMAVAIENYRLNLDIERTYLETITALALAVEAKDTYSAGHSKRVGFYSVQIAEVLGLDEDTRKSLQEAGVLHDVGKIGIKDEILLKSGSLTPEEQRMMQQHPVIGEAILKPVRSLGKISDVIRYHHEFFDGSGYPFHLKGEAIPLLARILTVADTYDAMVTDRPYRKRLSFEQAKAELQKSAGTQFDPKVVDAFLKVLADKEARQNLLSHS